MASVTTQESANPAKYLHLVHVLSQSMNGFQPLTLGVVCLIIPGGRVGYQIKDSQRGA